MNADEFVAAFHQKLRERMFATEALLWQRTASARGADTAGSDFDAFLERAMGASLPGNASGDADPFAILPDRTTGNGDALLAALSPATDRASSASPALPWTSTYDALREALLLAAR